MVKVGSFRGGMEKEERRKGGGERREGG